MKFVVTKEYGNEVEVKLHWETKDKIRNNLGKAAIGAICFAATYYIIHDSKKTQSKV